MRDCRLSGGRGIGHANDRRPRYAAGRTPGCVDASLVGGGRAASHARRNRGAGFRRCRQAREAAGHPARRRASFASASEYSLPPRFVVVYFWDTHRLTAFGIITIAYLLAGVLALWRFNVRQATDPAPFAATLAELERDVQWISRKTRRPAVTRARAEIASRRSLLAARAELDRARVTLALHDVKSIVVPSPSPAHAGFVRPARRDAGRPDRARGGNVALQALAARRVLRPRRMAGRAQLARRCWTRGNWQTSPQAELAPDRIDARLDVGVHRDRPAPLARRLARPLVRRVDPHLAAEPGDRRREIEVVDRRVGDDQRVARRIDARRDRPDHFLPVADRDVVVDHDDEFRVHELAQEAPHAEHHALRVAGVLLLHRDDRHPVAAAFGRQVEIGDLGKLLLQQRHEHFVQRDAEHRRLVGRLAGVGRVVDRVAAHRDPLDREHRKALRFVVVAGVVAERAFERGLVAGRIARIRPDESFEHDFGRRRHAEGRATGT